MAELKTRKSAASPREFLDRAAPDPARRRDCAQLVRMMQAATKAPPRMWGSAIVGFGASSYRTADGKEHEWFALGFSPRSKDLTLYLTGGLKPQAARLKALGKHKVSGSCLHITKLSDVDAGVLKAILAAAAKAKR